MAAPVCVRLLFRQSHSNYSCCLTARKIHFDATNNAKQMFVNTRAGVPKQTTNRTRPLTYEEMKPPEDIGRTKGWNSWHTANLFEEYKRTSSTSFEDIFIRKFMHGTWINLFTCPVIIKRRGNMIILAGLIKRNIPTTKFYFLIGYTEEFLSIYLKRPVKLELQTVDAKDMVMKYI